MKCLMNNWHNGYWRVYTYSPLPYLAISIRLIKSIMVILWSNEKQFILTSTLWLNTSSSSNLTLTGTCLAERTCIIFCDSPMFKIHLKITMKNNTSSTTGRKLGQWLCYNHDSLTELLNIFQHYLLKYMNKINTTETHMLPRLSSKNVCCRRENMVWPDDLCFTTPSTWMTSPVLV